MVGAPVAIASLGFVLALLPVLLTILTARNIIRTRPPVDRGPDEELRLEEPATAAIFDLVP